MGLFTRFRNKQPRAEPDLLPKDFSGLDLIGVNRTRADATISGSEAIYAAVSRISSTIAQIPLHLYKGDAIAWEHPLERLAAYAPNDVMTPYEYQQAMEVFVNTEGNAYALIVPAADGVTPVALDVLDASKVTPKRQMETGDIWYEFTLDTGKTVTVHNSCMIALHHVSSNGQKGVRPIDVLRGTLNYDASIKEFSLQQLEGVNSGVILTVPGTGLSPEKRKAQVDQFLDAYKVSKGRVVVLEGGITASTFKQDPVSAQVLDVERITRNRVATVYNIPPHMLGDYSDTSYATAEQTEREYMDLTIMPRLTQWEEQYNRKLLTWDMIRQGYRWRFDLSAMARADTAARSEMYQKAVRSSWMTVNEIRMREQLPPVPGGDRLLCSRDLMPYDMMLHGEVR